MDYLLFTLFTLNKNYLEKTPDGLINVDEPWEQYSLLFSLYDPECWRCCKFPSHKGTLKKVVLTNSQKFRKIQNSKRKMKIP